MFDSEFFGNEISVFVFAKDSVHLYSTNIKAYPIVIIVASGLDMLYCTRGGSRQISVRHTEESDRLCLLAN